MIDANDLRKGVTIILDGALLKARFLELLLLLKGWKNEVTFLCWNSTIN